MLGKEKENDRVKVDRYWPEEGEPPLHLHNIQVTLKEKLYDAELGIAVRKLYLTYTPPTEYDRLRQSQQSLSLSQLTQPPHPSQQSQTRLVLHYQYEGWPDHGVPSSAAPIRQLVRVIEQERYTFRSTHCIIVCYS